MTGPDIAIVLGGINTLIVTIAAVFAKRADARAAQGIEVSRRNTQKIAEVHELAKQVQVETNGMKAELVREVREASFAKGVKSETDKTHVSEDHEKR